MHIFAQLFQSSHCAFDTFAAWAPFYGLPEFLLETGSLSWKLLFHSCFNMHQSKFWSQGRWHVLKTTVFNTCPKKWIQRDSWSESGASFRLRLRIRIRKKCRILPQSTRAIWIRGYLCNKSRRYQQCDLYCCLLWQLLTLHACCSGSPITTIPIKINYSCLQMYLRFVEILALHF